MNLVTQYGLCSSVFGLVVHYTNWIPICMCHLLSQWHQYNNYNIIYLS